MGAEETRGWRKRILIFFKISLKNVLHDFTKYQVNQIVNKDFNVELSDLSRLSFSAT